MSKQIPDNKILVEANLFEYVPDLSMGFYNILVNIFTYISARLAFVLSASQEL